ncbi:MFS transporter [Anaerobacillus arseniciselenatis]|uniref:MFS transporter n=1 Tax=Anaerobacillus arseniciselenatis TaxID=85682 RepID=A0A1S2LIX4_9BACI|nr:MFS transporter [Anaerobacillus arseniciselenatis]OIJ12264.1 MFS transporter [Anaerobacillus arseniciselenatis]
MKGNTKLPVNPPFYYGWIIVFIAALSVFFSGPGQTYSISIFIDAYLTHFGWSSTLVSTMYLFATLFAGLLLFIVGRFVDKFGQRRMTVTVASLLGIACIFNSFLLGPTMLFIGFFMLRLFGQGSMTLIPGTLVPQWFVGKRGRALSFMAFGSFLSAAALPPFNAWLIDTVGWQTSWLVWAGLLFLIFVPLAFFFIRNKPEDVGLYPDNLTEEEVSGRGSKKSSIFEEAWTVKEAMRTKQFWLLLFCIAVPSMVNTGIVFHFVPILAESGIGRTQAAFILSIMAIVSFPVTFLAGFIVERVQANYVLTVAALGQIGIMFLLVQTDTYTAAIIFGIARGIVGGFEAISLGIIFPNFFGRAHIGSIKGVTSTIMVIGSAFGPLPFALAYDRFGSYQEIIYVMMVFPLLAMIFAFISKKPEKSAVNLKEKAS